MWDMYDEILKRNKTNKQKKKSIWNDKTMRFQQIEKEFAFAF